MKPNYLAGIFSILVCALLISCNISTLSATKTVNENAVNTSVALTLAAIGNSVATFSDTPSSAVAPTNTVANKPTLTPQPLATSAVIPSATPTEDTCNRAKFVTDVTIPDGSVFAPNTPFTKTWRFTNTGTCTWNTNYAIVFSSKDQMGAPAATNLPGDVAPGATVDISVQMTSPATDGDYKGYFMLRSDKGILFGTGVSLMAPVYVSIEVVSAQIIPTFQFGGLLHVFQFETLSYDFAGHYCDASWKNASGTVLPCPGANTDASGFVVKEDTPKLQDGNEISGVGLLTHPQWIDGGSISGSFPLFTVEDSMKFRAVLGCGYGGAACDVRFMLRYRIEGGALQELTHWDVKYSDTPLTIDQDLSSLAGKNVNFVLQVVTNGSSAQDWATWVNPRIVK
jgi:hypothetical protein